MIVGASGIVGSAAATLMAAEGWEVAGLALTPFDQDGVTPIAVDLQDRGALDRALGDLRPSHIVLSTWMRRSTEAEMISVNGAVVRDLLAAVRPARSVEHVALVTGLKHYLGPFEAFGTGDVPPTPFREEQGRRDVENFYYAQEDEVFNAAARDGFTWSVHRPNTMIGKAVGGAMNMGTTLAVHATICKATGRPFRFPGSELQWNGLTDMTDARLLARHILWASTTPEAANEAFNVVDGDVFRWSWMWGRIAGWFGIEPAPFDGVVSPLEEQMADDAPVWVGIAAEHGLAEADLSRLISPWHTDADLGRPMEIVTDMSKSRRLGFTAYQPTDDALFDLFARLRADRFIP